MAELTTSGRPSVLVPFPHATEDHQRANAKAIDEVGASILLPHERFTPDALRGHLEALFAAPERLAAMAAAARDAGRPDATQHLADLVVDLIGFAHRRPERGEEPVEPSHRAGSSAAHRLQSDSLVRYDTATGPSLCSERQTGAAA